MKQQKQQPVQTNIWDEAKKRMPAELLQEESIIQELWNLEFRTAAHDLVYPMQPDGKRAKKEHILTDAEWALAAEQATKNHPAQVEAYRQQQQNSFHRCPECW
jgi:hypothetical protein